MFKKKKDLDVKDDALQNNTEATATENENTDAEKVKTSTFKASLDDDENRKGVYIDKAEAEAFLAAQAKRAKRKKIITISVSVVIVLLVVFIVYKVVFGGNAGYINFSDDFLTQKDAKAVGQVIDNESTMTTYATVTNKDGVKSELKFSAMDSLLILSVTDGDNTINLRSWPSPEYEEMDESTVGTQFPKYKVNHDIVSSLVRLEYTASNLDGGKDFGINQIPNVTTVYSTIENGFRVKYTVPITVTKLDENADQVTYDYTFSFVVEFYLDEDGNLIVNVPKNEIVEDQSEEDYDSDADEMPRVASIISLPFFGATRQGDSGYFVTPDGSGALTYFDTARISQYDEYQKRIYGYDDTFDEFTYPNLTNETLCLPVYGIVRDDYMVTCFAEESEANAVVLMGQPGMKNLKFYYINYRFKWREFYQSQVSKSGSSYTFLETPSGIGDFKQKYVVTIAKDNDTLSYVDVANQTREFLIEKWSLDAETYDYLKDQVNTLENKNQNPDLLNIKVFFTDKNKASVQLFSQFKVMTTFEQAKNIIADATTENSRIRFSLLGWQNDGYYGNITRKYSIESVLGGTSGLKDLTEYGETNNKNISADVNMLLLYGKPKGASLRKAVVKDAGTIYLNYKIVTNAGVYSKSSTYYYMSPLYYNDAMLDKDIKKLSNLGFENVDLEQLGNLLYTDYNKENALLRQQALEYYKQWIVAYKEAFNSVSVYYGYEYAASVADNILDIPMESSSLFILDESVPFLQIVYHGLIDYYSSPINRTSNNVESMLKSIEYGAFFSYEVTEETTEELRYTEYNSLFKAQYSSLSAEIKKAYVVAEKVLAPVANATITNHVKITDNVYCTTYSNGYSIYVNYGEEAYDANGISVPSTGVALVSSNTVSYSASLD